jgi:hypothetical protein
MVKQVSIFLENRAGRLYEVTRLLASSGLNIRALSLADTSYFGILRLIVDDPEKALEILRKEHFTVSAAEVVAIEIDDKPGSLAGILGIFKEQAINVEYMYAFLARKPDKAILIFRFDDNEAVVKKLTAVGINLIGGAELVKL